MTPKEAPNKKMQQKTFQSGFKKRQKLQQLVLSIWKEVFFRRNCKEKKVKLPVRSHKSNTTRDRNKTKKTD